MTDLIDKGTGRFRDAPDPDLDVLFDTATRAGLKSAYREGWVAGFRSGYNARVAQSRNRLIVLSVLFGTIIGGSVGYLVGRP